jgi:hypothetical protein
VQSTKRALAASAMLLRRQGGRSLSALVVIILVVGAGLGGATLARPTAGANDVATLEKRLQKLEDQNEIRDLLVDYGHRLDTHDLQGYSELFASNGEWIGGFGRATGPAGILALLQKFMGTSPGDPKDVHGFHVLTNFSVQVDGDHATAWSRLVYFSRTPEKKPTPALGGHYDDTFVRENGHWKFLRRVVMLEIPYQDPRDESTVRGTKAPD